MRRWWQKAIAAFLAVLVLVPAGVYFYLRQSLPATRGSVVITGVPGPSGPVDIVRDADAIPHIFAATKRDGFFGLGYAHAQDRLWQMEFQRRIGFGRLSEIFGEVTLPQDRFLRTVGFGRAARAAWDGAPAWAKADVAAYVAGVNAFIATHHGRALPPEFTLLRFEPEPFTGPDVVVWVKMMAWDLSANYSFELLRDDLVRAVGEERMAQLMPPYPKNGLSIVGGTSSDHGEPGGASRAARADSDIRRDLRSIAGAFTSALAAGDPAVARFLLGGGRTEALGSNNWVVDGTMTASGKPMLANDPHLSSKTPSTWYLAHVSAGDFEIIGATLPGAPAVAIGRNRSIAWGETNVAADVQDLYREKIDASGTHAEYAGAQEPITVVRETIKIKGTAPANVDVRITRHGPLVSDAINFINATTAQREHKPAVPPLEPLAFRWTALDASDGTLQSFLKLNEARNWGEFTGALRDFVAPSQNFVYADVDGHIGYYAPGRIPIRARGDGSRPIEGWTGDAEWTGWVPFEALPHAFDPADHFIVTANHRPEPADYPYLLGLEWTEPYRAGRIIDLLTGRAAAQTAAIRTGGVARRLAPDDFARVQADTFSPHAASLLPLLLDRVKPESERDRTAVDLLRKWDLDARGDGAAPAIFSTWFQSLLTTLLADELSAPMLESYRGKYSFASRFVANTLSSNDVRWCDDVRTAKRETCEEAVTQSLHAALDDLTKAMGGNVASWRWDRIHHAMFPHQGLDSVGLLRPLLSRDMPNGGDWSTVDVGPVAADHPYEQHSVPGYRQIVDLSPANDSRFLNDVGESGHFLSPHYDDFLADWRAVRHRKMRMVRAEAERGAIGTLRLVPR